MRLATHFDVSIISLIFANPLSPSPVRSMKTFGFFDSEPPLMVPALFMWRFVLLIEQIEPAKFAVFALSHFALARIVFVLVPLNTFGGISSFPTRPSDLLPRYCNPCHCVGLSLGGGGVQWHSID